MSQQSVIGSDHVNSGEVLIAILSRMKAGTIFRDDKKFYDVFDTAAQENPELLRKFRKHPQYHDSEYIMGLLHTLDMGGVLERFNPGSDRHEVTKLITGPYGKDKFNSFDEEQKKIIDDIAKQLQKLYAE